MENGPSEDAATTCGSVFVSDPLHWEIYSKKGGCLVSPRTALAEINELTFLGSGPKKRRGSRQSRKTHTELKGIMLAN